MFGVNMNAQAREFVTLYMAREGCTEKAAIAFLKMLDQRDVPEVLSKLRLEALGQRRLDVGPAPLTVYRERSKRFLIASCCLLTCSKL